MIDRVGDPPRALVADLDVEVGTPGEFLLAADVGDGRAQLVIRLDAVLRAVHVALQLRVAQVTQRVGAAHQRLRASELVNATLGAIEVEHEVLWLHVVGKGNRPGRVTLPPLARWPSTATSYSVVCQARRRSGIRKPAGG